MIINVVGPFEVNAPFATEIAFAKGLRGIGHTVVEFDPNTDNPDVMDRSADTTIVFKSALTHNDSLRGLRNVVLFQPDDPRFPHIQGMLDEMRPYTNKLLLFRSLRPGAPEDHAPFAGRDWRIGSISVTADPELYRPLERPKVIDFCFIGSLSDPRCHWQRHEMIGWLADRGYRVHAEHTRDMARMMELINSSRVVLNHSAEPGELTFGKGLGYQCRHFEVGFAGGCLLSNRVLVGSHSPPVQGFCEFDSWADFREKAVWLIENELARAHYARSLAVDVFVNHRPTLRAKELISTLEWL